MKLNICCITYNQQSFIIQTIEGFLNQKTNFDVEIIISDDCSSDNTQKICGEYQKKYPGKFKLLLNKHNIGMLPNFIQAYNACTGKYIAICEGDDYWADENKLQKQVDFLEANPDYAICFHAVNILENGQLRASELNLSDKEETYSINDLAKFNLIHTPSVVFRNGLIKEQPAWFNKSPVGDYVLHLLNARKGLIKYFPETMAVYRMHTQSVWGQKSRLENDPKWIAMLDMLLQEDFEPEVKQILLQQRDRVLKEYFSLILQYEKFDLLKEAVQTYYDNDTSSAINIVVSSLVQKINDLEQRMQLVEGSRSYKLAKKLSALKNNISSKNSKTKSRKH